MCSQCLDLVALIVEETGHDEGYAMHVLWEHTAYPFNSFDETLDQVVDFLDAA